MSELIKKLAGFKGIGFIVIALIAGVVLLLWPSGTKSADNTVAAADADKYVAEAEKQATELICKISGVQSCEVMISITDGYSYLYATNQKLQEDGEKRDVEKELAVITGDGKEAPVIICEYMPKICGIAVVYKGEAASAGQIRSLLTALFNLPEEYIYVTK